MILTLEFLTQQDACADGIQYVIDNNLIGMEYNDVIKYFLSHDMREYAGFLIDQKKTEAYITASDDLEPDVYVVYNQFTAQNEEYSSMEELKTGLIAITKQMLEQNKPNVCRVIRNASGDSVMIPINDIINIELTELYIK